MYRASFLIDTVFKNIIFVFSTLNTSISYTTILNMNTCICDDVFMNLSSIVKYEYRYMHGSLYDVNSIINDTIQGIQAICGTSTTIKVCTTNTGINDLQIPV